MKSLRLFAWWCVGVAIAWFTLVPYARAEWVCTGPILWSCYAVGGQTDGCAAHCSTLQGGQAAIEWVDANNTWCKGPTGVVQYSGSRSWCAPGQAGSSAQNCCMSDLPACTPPDVRRPDGTCGAGCPAAGTGGGGYVTVTAASAPDTVCKGGCEYSTGGGLGFADGTYTIKVGGSKGRFCQAGQADGTPATTPEAKCVQSGQGFGTVNGQVVCTGVPNGSKSTTETKTPTSTTTTTTTTSCTGDGSCTTTTTNQYTSGGSGPNGTGPGSTTVPGTGPGTPGAGVGEASETKEQPSFCEENPNSPMCKPSTDECERFPSRVGCAELGTLADVQPSSKAVPFSITPAAVPMNSSCPASVSLPYGATFSWQPICDGLGWIRPVILALASLGAALIVVGGFQRG
jgi:hypothetical protein